MLDAMAGDSQTVFPPELFTEVLPRLSSVFENLDKLTSSDVTARRLATAGSSPNWLAGRSARWNYAGWPS